MARAGGLMWVKLCCRGWPGSDPMDRSPNSIRAEQGLPFQIRASLAITAFPLSSCPSPITGSSLWLGT